MAYVDFIRHDDKTEKYSFRTLREALDYIAYFDDTDKDLYRDIVVYDGKKLFCKKW
jgi:hypothetical protein